MTTVGIFKRLLLKDLKLGKFSMAAFTRWVMLYTHIFFVCCVQSNTDVYSLFYLLWTKQQRSVKKKNPTELWISYFHWSKNYLWAYSGLVVLRCDPKLCIFIRYPKSGPGPHLEEQLQGTVLLGGQLLICYMMCDVERIAGLPSHQCRWKPSQLNHVKTWR